jgi:purine-nucleoside phosphorylase
LTKSDPERQKKIYNIIMELYNAIQETAAFLKTRITAQPLAGIILGSGLGNLADHLESTVTIPYDTIPNFPLSTVKGHAGALLFGKLGGKDVVMMSGRFHYYRAMI